jgi:hypothetical protein
MAALDADAEYFQPRLFAVYGLYGETRSGLPPREFLGWGIDHGDDEGALFWDEADRSMHRASSAQGVLEFHQRLGEAHLKWLS